MCTSVESVTSAKRLQSQYNGPAVVSDARKHVGPDGTEHRRGGQEEATQTQKRKGDILTDTLNSLIVNAGEETVSLRHKNNRSSHMDPSFF